MFKNNDTNKDKTKSINEKLENMRFDIANKDKCKEIAKKLCDYISKSS